MEKKKKRKKKMTERKEQNVKYVLRILKSISVTHVTSEFVPNVTKNKKGNISLST